MEKKIFFDKKYKCVSFKVHYKGLTLNMSRIYAGNEWGLNVVL